MTGAPQRRGIVSGEHRPHGDLTREPRAHQGRPLRALVGLFAVISCAHGGCHTGTVTARTSARPQHKGLVITESFHSEALGVDKDVVVYLPIGYDREPTRRWPVLYYLHGLGGTETDWTVLGQLATAADKLALDAIVVMPDGDDSFYANSSRPTHYAACLRTGKGLFIPAQPRRKTCVKRAAYETYITKDLIAWLDGKYRTIASRDGRGVAGVSMGGFGALQLSMRHPDLYAAAASHSGIDALMYVGPFPYEKGKVVLETEPRRWGASVGAIGAWVRSIFGPDLAIWQGYDPVVLIESLSPGKLALYLDCGTEDDFMLHNGAAYLHDLLLARQIRHEFFLGPGRHDFAFVRSRVANSLAFLSAHVAKSR